MRRVTKVLGHYARVQHNANALLEEVSDNDWKHFDGVGKESLLEILSRVASGSSFTDTKLARRSELVDIKLPHLQDC